MSVLVTGTGRCGTGYFTALLKQVGFQATHEALFTPWGYRSDMPFQYEQSWLAAPHLDLWRKNNPEGKIILLWREPEDVVRSMLGIKFFEGQPTDPYQKYAHKFSDAWVHEGGALDRAIYWWNTWNRRIFWHADLVVNVADPCWEKIAPLYGRTPEAFAEANKEVPPNTNGRARGSLDRMDEQRVDMETYMLAAFLEAASRC